MDQSSAIGCIGVKRLKDNLNMLLSISNRIAYGLLSLPFRSLLLAFQPLRLPYRTQAVAFVLLLCPHQAQAVALCCRPRKTVLHLLAMLPLCQRITAGIIIAIHDVHTSDDCPNQKSGNNDSNQLFRKVRFHALDSFSPELA